MKGEWLTCTEPYQVPCTVCTDAFNPHETGTIISSILQLRESSTERFRKLLTVTQLGSAELGLESWQRDSRVHTLNHLHSHSALPASPACSPH